MITNIRIDNQSREVSECLIWFRFGANIRIDITRFIVVVHIIYIDEETLYNIKRKEEGRKMLDYRVTLLRKLFDDGELISLGQGSCTETGE